MQRFYSSRGARVDSHWQQASQLGDSSTLKPSRRGWSCKFKTPVFDLNNVEILMFLKETTMDLTLCVFADESLRPTDKFP
jgi:hypothetical protein